jgi:hypothetical protein
VSRAFATLIASIAIAFGVGGCVTPQYAWQKPGASVQDFNQAKYRCMQESTRQGYSSQPVYNTYTGQYLGQTARGGAYTDWGMYNACMQASGWTLVRREAS